MNGEWMKRGKWKVSHFVRADKRTLWMGEITGWAACGSCIKINDGLTPEPTGVDTQDRCARCLRTLSRPAVGGGTVGDFDCR